MSRSGGAMTPRPPPLQQYPPPLEHPFFHTSSCPPHLPLSTHSSLLKPKDMRHCVSLYNLPNTPHARLSDKSPFNSHSIQHPSAFFINISKTFFFTNRKRMLCFVYHTYSNAPSPSRLTTLHTTPYTFKPLPLITSYAHCLLLHV